MKKNNRYDFSKDIPKPSNKVNPKYDFGKPAEKTNTRYDFGKPAEKTNTSYDFGKKEPGCDAPEEKINPRYNFSAKTIDAKITEEDFQNPQTLLEKVEINLNQKIKGQEHITRLIARDIYQHMQRGIRIADGTIDLTADDALTPVILLIGPSSVGKTLTATEAANVFNLPVGRISCTSLTEEGYVGQKAQDAFVNLLKDAKAKYLEHHLSEDDRKEYETARGFLRDLSNNLIAINPATSKKHSECKEIADRVEKSVLDFAQNFGVLIFDEFDKLAKEKDGGGKKVNKEGVQNALLSGLDGKMPVELMIPDEYSRNPMAKKSVFYNTKNTLVFVTGVFEGIESIIQKNGGALDPSLSDFGITASSDNRSGLNPSYEGLRVEHLSEYGIVPQFLKRITRWHIFKELNETHLKQIFASKIKTVNEKFANSELYPDIAHLGGNITFTSSAIDLLVEISSKVDSGARRIEHLLADLPTALGLYINDHKEYKNSKSLEITPAILKKALSYIDLYRPVLEG